jgi:surface antigen
VQSDRTRLQQRQQADQRRPQVEQPQRQRNDRYRAQENQRNYAQRPDSRRPDNRYTDNRHTDNRRPAGWQNNNRHDPRWNQQPPRRNNYQHYATGNHYRTAGWNRWRERHYVAAPRYHWNYDPYSRPWFDYNRVSYISIYRPTYVIPYNAYQSYGTSYYGPVGCNRDVVGAVLGGVAGGLIGAHNGGGGATVGGAIIGALLGGTLGQVIDMNDQACYGQVLEYAPSNQPVYWESDGAQYQVTPLRTYQNGSGEYCREYQTYVYIDGREQQAYGTACRQPDGAWRAS